MIQDDFMGDFYLGCPSCKEAIHFPLIRNPNHIYDKRPKQCSKCGEEFDWSDEMKGGNTVMHDEVDDAAQVEWCRKWSEKKMQKKIKRVQHWCNFKIYLKYAWYEFKAAIKGR